ncbi:MAG TPA: HlyD family efflux transporter periplasmic adaptor subunit [Longilinea sp.]|nr:HlyD family efflux transporter periplasmic adaptor subunit [Longilinea sp.]
MKKYLNKQSLILLPALAVLAGLSACSALSMGTKNAEPTAVPIVEENSGVLAEGRVVPHQSAVLAFPVGGMLGERPVQEGGTVSAGDVLASLTSRDNAEAALNNAELELEVAQRQKNDLDADAALARAQAVQAVDQAQTHLTEAQKAFDDTHTRKYRDVLDDKEEAYQKAKDDLDDAQKNLDKYQDLDVNNSTRKSAQTRYDDAKEDYQQALYERDSLLNPQQAAESGLTLAGQVLAKAKRTLENYKDNGPDVNLLAQAEKRLAAAQAQLRAAQSVLADQDLKAPFAGTVMNWVDGMLPGVWLAAGQPVLTLADTSSWEIETTDLTELKVVDIKVGQAATLHLDALPALELSGEVISIERVFIEKSGDIQYTVHVRISNPPPEIRWGMSAEVTFDR